MEAKLTIVGGRANKKRIVLQLPAVIGRSREAGLTIAHAMVSRQHCQIFEANGTLRVRDLGSLNGTFVGQKQIEETALVPGDELTVGPLTFRVDYSSTESSPPPVISSAGRDDSPFISGGFLGADEQADEPVIDLGSLVDDGEGVQSPEGFLQPEVTEEDSVEEVCEPHAVDRPAAEEPKCLFSDLPPIVSDVVSAVIPETATEPASSSVSAVFEDAPAVEEAASWEQSNAEELEAVIELEEIREASDDEIVEVPAESVHPAEAELEPFLAAPPSPPSQEEHGDSDLAAFFRDLQK